MLIYTYQVLTVPNAPLAIANAYRWISSIVDEQIAFMRKVREEHAANFHSNPRKQSAHFSD